MNATLLHLESMDYDSNSEYTPWFPIDAPPEYHPYIRSRLNDMKGLEILDNSTVFNPSEFTNNQIMVMGEPDILSKAEEEIKSIITKRNNSNWLKVSFHSERCSEIEDSCCAPFPASLHDDTTGKITRSMNVSVEMPEVIDDKDLFVIRRDTPRGLVTALWTTCVRATESIRTLNKGPITALLTIWIEREHHGILKHNRNVIFENTGVTADVPEADSNSDVIALSGEPMRIVDALLHVYELTASSELEKSQMYHAREAVMVKKILLGIPYQQTRCEFAEMPGVTRKRSLSEIVPELAEFRLIPSDVKQLRRATCEFFMKAYYKNKLEGIGSDGYSLVFRGKFGAFIRAGALDIQNGSDFAVKKVHKDIYYWREGDIKASWFSERSCTISHPNIITIYGVDEDIEFYYISMEICAGSLFDYIGNENKKMSMRELNPISSKQIIRQTTEGIAYLHSLNIAHRALKPENVLISIGKSAKILITDFGISVNRKYLLDEKYPVRSGVWMAPEQLNGDYTSLSMDIFSLGCIYYYVITDGSHPFGKVDEQRMNILSGTKSLEELAFAKSDLPVEIIISTLKLIPHTRPPASKILEHPFFWEYEKQMLFLGDVADRLDNKRDYPAPFYYDHLIHLTALDFSGKQLNWIEELCPVLKEFITGVDKDLNKRYNGTMEDLVKLIRDTKKKYSDLPHNVRSSLGEVPDGLVSYFTIRFPKMLSEVHEVMKNYIFEELFIPYYSDDARQELLDTCMPNEMIGIKDYNYFFLETVADAGPPLHWGNETQLDFLLKATDRLLKEFPTSPLLKRLEQNDGKKTNWTEHLCEHLRICVTEGSRVVQYDAYSWRDLLRLIRNTKDNYSNLPELVRTALGLVPNEFVVYFTKRFPKLLLHVYNIMKMCSGEAIFKPYYSNKVRNLMKKVRRLTTNSSEGTQRTINYDVESPLCSGSYVTTVFEGEYYGCEVAVKRLLKFDLAVNEQKLLMNLPIHPNIIRYYHMEPREPFMLLALELCSASLDQLFENVDENGISAISKNKNIPALSDKEIIRQILKGLVFLHSNNIVHRDLKPQNILIAIIEGKGAKEAQIRISDFGLAKKIDPKKIEQSSGMAGTDGWNAQEVREEGRSFSSDIFSAGCIFFYVLKKGRAHPFGSGEDRQMKINRRGNPTTRWRGIEERYLVRHLISPTLSHNPTQRPTAAALLNYPYFWDLTNQLNFFCDVSNRFKQEKRNFMEKDSAVRKALEVINQDWDTHMNEPLILKELYDFDITNYGHITYIRTNVYDLIRAIRNVREHYRKFSQAAQSALNNYSLTNCTDDEMIANCFTSKFPDLLRHVYDALKNNKGPRTRIFYTEEQQFKQYYCEQS